MPEDNLTSSSRSLLPAARYERVEAILFDLGDTLIHGNFTAGASESVWQDIYQQLLNPGRASSLPDLARFRAAWHDHVQTAMARTWREKPEQELEFLPMVQRAFEASGHPQSADLDFIRQVVSLEHELLYRRVVSVAPEAVSTLHQLRRHGYWLGLVSNFCNLPEVAYAQIRQVGLLECFDATVLSCEVGWRKPSPRIYQAICERLNVDPARCLFVGDRLIEDVQGPHQMGMLAIQTVQFRQEEPVAQIHPDEVIRRLDELPALLSVV